MNTNLELPGFLAIRTPQDQAEREARDFAKRAAAYRKAMQHRQQSED